VSRRFLSPTLSVVIPALNEAATLPVLLRDLRRQKEISLEIIVGDGGSTDRTAALARQDGAFVVAAPRGRGSQMNAAVRKARGRFVLFLHADSTIRDRKLLVHAVNALTLAMARHGSDSIAGHFPLRFIRSRSRQELAYRYLEGKTHFNRPNTTNGDQGFLLKRRFFNRLGGFDEQHPFLEDQKLAEKIRVTGRWITLPGLLYSSARRFETEGFYQRYLLMSIIMGAHSTGLDGFFTRSPSAYPSQPAAEKLLLKPFISTLWVIMREELGLAGSVRLWLRAGRFIRLNTWQLFYFVDVCRAVRSENRRYPCLGLYDRYIAQRLNVKLVDGLVGALSFLAIMGCVNLYCSLNEPRRVVR
jgi:rSAM/selenodomain-associated transferase 2